LGKEGKYLEKSVPENSQFVEHHADAKRYFDVKTLKPMDLTQVVGKYEAVIALTSPNRSK